MMSRKLFLRLALLQVAVCLLLVAAALIGFRAGYRNVEIQADSERANAVYIVKRYPIDRLLEMKDQSPFAITEPLKDLREVVINIEPHTWSEIGGNGTVHFDAESRELVIRQTETTHQQISTCLNLLDRYTGDE